MKAVRPSLVLILAGVALTGCHSQNTSPTPVSSTPQGASLKSVATGVGKLVGTAVQSGFLGDSRYHAVFAGDFNYVTAEYEMKWNVIEGTRGINNFSAGDTIIADASAQGMQVKGHTLIWHGSNPGWLSSLSASDFRSAFEDHIR